MKEAMNTALRQPGVRPAEGGRWPLWGIGAVLLLMSRLLYPTPSLSPQDQTVVTGKLVDILVDKTTNLYSIEIAGVLVSARGWRGGPRSVSALAEGERAARRGRGPAGWRCAARC